MSQYTWKNIDIFHSHCPIMLKRGENVRILGVYGQNIDLIESDNCYVVTYYKVTQFCREPFCLSCII